MESEKIPYPKSVFFIWIHQIFERFSFWGIVVVLPLFLRNVLLFNDDSATAIYHGFTIMGYLSSFIGAIVADSYYGKFKTIVYFSMVYFVGTFLLTTSATPFLSSQIQLLCAIVGLIFTAVASGSIKPCIIAFGGDQYKLPEQQKQLDAYFPILYLIINFSLALTAITTPILRKDVSCFDDETCYSLAFLVPFAFVIIAFGFLLLGKSRYTHTAVEVNVVTKALRCMKCAVKKRFMSLEKIKDHWLDYADSEFSDSFIGDVKQVQSLFVLFLPITIFWALFDQQFSRWTFQATRMNDVVFGYAIKPDQFAMLNFVLTFAFIPLFEKVIFPVLAKCNLLKKPLQKVVNGAIFASLSFIICGCVELKIESTLDAIPSADHSQLNFINLHTCPMEVIILQNSVSRGNNSQLIMPSDNYIFRNLPAGTVTINLATKTEFMFEQSFCSNVEQQFYENQLISSESHSAVIIPGPNNEINLKYIKQPDDLKKSLENNAKLRFVNVGLIDSQIDKYIILKPLKGSSEYRILLKANSTETTVIDDLEITPNKYNFVVDNKTISEFEVFVGGNYFVSISSKTNLSESDLEYSINLFTIVKPNSISIVWLLPQYIVMSVAEVMIEISLTSFAYSQAPKDMKSLLQVVNLIPPALGGILVVFVAEAKLFQRQSFEFFLFSAINFCSALVLIFLAKNYKPVSSEEKYGSI